MTGGAASTVCASAAVEGIAITAAIAAMAGRAGEKCCFMMGLTRANREWFMPGLVLRDGQKP
jgi:hypothetical protein